MKREDRFYQALLARDPRFDGKFFIGVKTTGIYCRPICPAKPKRENVEFFSTYLEAERAGYRPCLRCHPESAPQSPVWIGTSAVVRRAVKSLHSLETLDFNEEAFAERFGVGARHLRRLFIAEIGKTPKQLAFENRLNLARKLILETRLPLAEVAFAAGFNSIRRFNSAFQDRFKKAPREIRRHRPARSEGLVISLPYRPPFDFEGLLASYRNHQMGNLEWFEAGKMHRAISFNGQFGQIAISDQPDKSSLAVEIDFPDTSAIHLIASKVRHLFDLDSDPLVIANVIESHPPFRKLWKKSPGIRLPSGWEPFEIAVAAVLGQLVSVERSRALVHDLIEIAGSEVAYAVNGKPLKLFPTPQQILDADLSSLKSTQMRKRTLKELSAALLEKRISLEATQDVDEFVQKITQLPGIGPWTANYIALKALRSTDVFPANDLILARTLKLHSSESIDRMSPWRGYVAALFWRNYSQTLTKKGKKT